ncbi:interleukin-5 receptor subunit alpha-like [Pholidichthys leucotaenia]
MKPFPLQPVLWSSLLFLWLSHNEVEGHGLDICSQEIDEGQDPDGDKPLVCLIYPTNKLNCSWSLNPSENYTQFSVDFSFCDEELETNHSVSKTFVERVGSKSVILPENVSSIVIHLNMFLNGSWTSEAHRYEKILIELLSSPPNFSASIQNGSLMVSWAQPYHAEISNKDCFAYQLDLGDQGQPKNLDGKLSYVEHNVEPTYTYSMRIRTRVKTNCWGCQHWSEWSPTIVVEQSVDKLNLLVIVSIALGIPMILLALVLLVRYQRLSEVLFPPIPQPPSKYKYFLEKTDTFFHPVQPAKPEEEITEVEDAEQSPKKSS